MTDKPSALPALTGLRFFAALAIANAHLGSNVLIPGWGYAFQTAALGMPLFFTLSGFIIHYVYSAPLNRAWGRETVEFGIARFTRLYPLFLFFLVYNFLFWDFGNVLAHPLIGASYLTLTSTWWYWQIDGRTIESNVYGISWSIPTEVFFYLCYALILYRIGRVRSRRACIAWLIGLFAFAYGALYWIWQNEFTAFQDALLAIFPGAITREQSASENVVEWFIYLSPYVHLLEFISGVLVCQIFLLSKPAGPGAASVFWIGAIGTAVLLVLLNYVDFVHVPWLAFVHFLQRSFLFVPVLCALILGAALGQSRGAKVLSLPALLLLGEASYSLYLGHSWAAPIANVTAGFAHPLLGLAYVLLTACAISVGLYLLVERPAKTGLRRLISSSRS